jgi:nucleotide-binding universal stress UspA family protein
VNESFAPHGPVNRSLKPSIVSNARTFCRRSESSPDTPQRTSPKRILLPIDVAKCPLEVFPFVNELAEEHAAAIILLHVLNRQATNGEFQKDSVRAAEEQLEQLARKFINPRLALRTHVRTGTPSDAILAEATQSSVDLIVLTSYASSSIGKRPVRSQIVQTVLNTASCNITLLPVRTSFHCAQQWELVDEIVRALNYVGLLRPAPNHS